MYGFSIGVSYVSRRIMDKIIWDNLTIIIEIMYVPINLKMTGKNIGPKRAIYDRCAECYLLLSRTYTIRSLVDCVDIDSSLSKNLARQTTKLRCALRATKKNGDSSAGARLIKFDIVKACRGWNELKKSKMAEPSIAVPRITNILDKIHFPRVEALVLWRLSLYSLVVV